MNRGKIWNAAKTVLMTAGIAVLIGLVTVITGHGKAAEAGGATQDEPQVCTEIGCTSGLTTDLSKIRAAVPRGGNVRICLAGDCRILQRKNLGLVEINADDLVTGEDVAVRVGIRNRKGILRKWSRKKYEVVEVQPNGPGCLPVCHQVHIRLGAGGMLRAA